MNKDGLHSYCKPCQNAKCAQYQRNSLAAKQEGRPVTDSPADVAMPEEAFTTSKVPELETVKVAKALRYVSASVICKVCKIVKKCFSAVNGIT